MQYLKEILFIDIETVPVQPEYGLLSEAMQAEWVKKTKFLKSQAEGIADPSVVYGERAGIYSEFAKVVCIGFGSLVLQEGKWKMRLKTLVYENEHQLLTAFCDMLHRFTAHNRNMQFCGHNIKEFDMPFLCRRMVINGIPLPPSLDLAGKKPWEVSHIDTMDMWKFGDHKNFTSLSLLAEVFGIPSPKSDLDGSMVASVYWNEKDLERIGKYCLQDVYTTAKVFLRLKGIANIDPEPEYV